MFLVFLPAALDQARRDLSMDSDMDIAPTEVAVDLLHKDTTPRKVAVNRLGKDIAWQMSGGRHEWNHFGRTMGLKDHDM